MADRTGLQLPDGDYETVAGYVMSQLGRIPEEGEAVDAGGHRLAVAQVQGRRVVTVALTPAAADDVVH